MPITDPLILPADVTIEPVARLSPALRARLGAAESEFAITRPRGRVHAKLLSPEGAVLLEEFRRPIRVAEAIRAFATRQGRDPELVLAEAFPLLHDCFNGRFLVPFNSPEAARILPTRDRGERIGRYVILRALQALDDTELYQARSTEGTLVALKAARPASGRETVMSMSREAAVLRHLDGSGAPALLSKGRSRGRPWLAMSWQSGVHPDIAFGEWRERTVSEGTRRLHALALSLLRSYAALHARGVVHGDVHPKNLLVGRDGSVTLLDFGLARALPPLRLGGAPARGGVALYYPPEYAAAELAGRSWPNPSEASEQYAVGALLYHLLTGRPYLDFAMERGEMLRQIVAAPPLPFASRLVAPWPGMEHLLRVALAKSPEHRFASVAAFADAVEQLGAEAGRPEAVAAASDDSARRVLLDGFLSGVDIDGADFPGAAGSRLAAPTGSLMHGGSGVAYALLRLACRFDDARLFALADTWLTRIEASLDAADAFDAPGTTLTADLLGPVSPFHSVTGVHLLRSLASASAGDRPAASEAVARFVETSRRPWDRLDLTIGRGGTLLGCCMLLEALPAEWNKATRLVTELGSATLESVWGALDRLPAMAESVEPGNPGIAHGWAGLLYIALRWCERAGQPYPSGLRERLDELAGMAEPVGRGIRWPRGESPFHTEAELREEIPGWCNGPAGFLHLWTLAHRLFAVDRYLSLAEGCAWSAWEARTKSPTLCCGLAGQAYALLNFYKHTGDDLWLTRARTLADRATALVLDSRYQEPRPLSLFSGRPGVVLLCADLDHPETAAMPFFEPEGWPALMHHG